MAALVCVLGALFVWLRPWADCTLTAEATITTDGGGVVARGRASRLFRSDSQQSPELRLVLDLTSLAGELALVQVRGEARGRWVKGANQQPVAFAAELARGNRGEELPLGGWGFRGNSAACRRPLGPRSHRAARHSGRDYWRPVRGSLWRVLRVPEQASLVLHVRAAGPAERRAGVETPRPPSIPASHTIAARASEAKRRRPDIFIYLIDALRADHLGCYGYERSTSPNIDAFADEAVVYEEAQTVSSWTRPAVTTVLTGLQPPLHGSLDKRDRLADWPLFMSEALKQVGYGTWSIVSNPNVLPVSGFDQGYDGFVAAPLASAEWVNGQARRILARQRPDRPLLMYIHTMGPHEPYSPDPEAFARFDRGFHGVCDGSLGELNKLDKTALTISGKDLAHLVDRYDAEVYEADRAFGGFITLLRETGRDEGALIVLLADHGEALGEHGTLTHGFSLGREVLHVPLIVKFPNGEFGRSRVERRVSLVDVFPTVVRQAGMADILERRHAGRDLSPLDQSKASRGRPVYAQISPPSFEEPHLLMVIDEDGYKRVMADDADVDADEYSWIGLWDTGSDPGESTDLTASMPVRAAYAEQLLAEWLAEQERLAKGVEGGPSTPIELTDEMQEHLRALGYLR